MKTFILLEKSYLYFHRFISIATVTNFFRYNDIIQLIMIILFSVGTTNIVEMLNIFNILASIIGCSTYIYIVH